MLTISTKNSVVDFRLCSECTTDFSCNQHLGWQGTNISNTHEKSTKDKSVTEWDRCGKCGTMDKNVECLCCHKVEAVEYFKLLGMRYGDVNAVTREFEGLYPRDIEILGWFPAGSVLPHGEKVPL